MAHCAEPVPVATSAVQCAEPEWAATSGALYAELAMEESSGNRRRSWSRGWALCADWASEASDAFAVSRPALDEEQQSASASPAEVSAICQHPCCLEISGNRCGPAPHSLASAAEMEVAAVETEAEVDAPNLRSLGAQVRVLRREDRTSANLGCSYCCPISVSKHRRICPAVAPAGLAWPQ